MKFTNGYWQLREQYQATYAVEYNNHIIDKNELKIFAPNKHIGNRGDVLNLGMLTITLTSPIENVIKVNITHFKDGKENTPIAPVIEENPFVTITEDAEKLTYMSGNTKAVINKNPLAWEIAFYDGDRKLTDTGFRNMAHMKDINTKKVYMLEQLALDVDEYIYGLGERFTPFIKNGQIVEMWNEDGGTASEISYKNVPFYISNKGYGVYTENEGDVAYEIGSEKVERVQFSVEGESLSYYIINGHTPMGAVEKYTQLLGKPALPPAWSFGLWLTTSFTTNYDEETTSSFINGMAERNIPLHVFHYDSYWMEGFKWCNFKWDPNTFPDPAGMIKRNHEKGLKVCVWINSYIAQNSELFDEGLKNGYFIKKTDGTVWQTDMWVAGMALVDFTNPVAKEWYLSKLKALMDMGVDCFKTDFGERIPVKDVVYYDGSDPVKMHNYYTYLYNEAVFGLLEKERGLGEAIVFARSATAGGQKFPAHWGGDCSASYPSMAETVRGGLSLACAGFGFWSHDISGFEATAPADIYKRWCQFGLLSSHSRLHGSSSYRVPWLFDEEACDVLRKFVNLKCSLMPYLYAQAVRTHEEGRPMLRPLVLDFNDDLAAITCDKEYMFGDGLLVAPIFKETGEVEYYLPSGKWINFITKNIVEGGKYIKEKHDYFSLPLMVKPNYILAVGNNIEVPDYDYTDGTTLYLSNFDDGAECKIFIPDSKGNKKATVKAIKNGNEITVTISGSLTNYKIESLVEGISIKEQIV